MRPNVKPWSVRLAVTAAALAVVASGAGRAWASCGDYVMVGEAHSGHHAPAADHDAGGGASSTGASSPAEPRCRGLECQRRLPQPAAPAKALVQSGPHEWAWHAALADRDCLAVGLAPSGSVLGDLEGHFRRLLRPPALALRRL